MSSLRIISLTARVHAHCLVRPGAGLAEERALFLLQEIEQLFLRERKPRCSKNFYPDRNEKRHSIRRVAESLRLTLVLPTVDELILMSDHGLLRNQKKHRRHILVPFSDTCRLLQCAGSDPKASLFWRVAQERLATFR